MGKPAATARLGLPSLNHSFPLDCIITGRSKDFLAQDVQPLVEQCLAKRGLALAREKTRVTHIEEGFAFLGTRVRQ